MAAQKEIRFKTLVDQSGPPEVVTLWADPKKDNALMKLVKQGRIATILQKATGTKKDFGLIGFHPQPFAAYLVFPKPLKADKDAIVIGIKYDLLKMPKETIASRPTRQKKIVPVKPAEIIKTFAVKIVRSGVAELVMNVDATDAFKAKEQVMKSLLSRPLSLPPEHVRNKVVSVVENKLLEQSSTRRSIR